MALLRMAIGWQFLYEGLIKIQQGAWTAAGYLSGAGGPAAGCFHWLATNEALMPWVNALNIAGLTLIGICLMLGLATRLAAVLGMLMLALYYLAYPPLFAPTVGPVEGHYLIVNKNLVELLALLAVCFYPASRFGIDGVLAGLIGLRRNRHARQTGDATPSQMEAVRTSMILSRRKVLAGLVGLPVLGGFVLAAIRKQGFQSVERTQVADALAPGERQVDGMSGATIHRFAWTEVSQLEKKPPMARIKDLELSRLILGGNLIGGWAHARDLIYVDKLVKAYHHERKIFETFQIAEQCGVNAIVTNPVLCEIMSSYWGKTDGKIKFISDCGGGNMVEMVKRSVDTGAAACYVHGGVADSWAKQGKFDKFAEVLDEIRKHQIPARIGGHSLRTVQACVEAGLEPDFWMKTLHKKSYWSATDRREHDNIWCEEPEETIEFMKNVQQPWIAFKVMAAGAIQPADAFRYAFENGADFVCAGMYDFQIVEDVNLAVNVLDSKLKRGRPWCAVS